MREQHMNQLPVTQSYDMRQKSTKDMVKMCLLHPICRQEHNWLRTVSPLSYSTVILVLVDKNGNVLAKSLGVTLTGVDESG